MTVLVVSKPTNLEQHGELVRSQAMTGKLGSGHIDILSESHDQHYRCLNKVRECLTSLGMSFVEMQRGDMRPSGVFDLVVSVGGDGTLLSASHSVNGETPMIGVKSSDSSVGYLCAGAEKQVEQLFRLYADGCLSYQQRSRLIACITKAEDRSEVKTFPILNDFLYANSSPASTTRYKLSYGGKQENQKSSGIWVSTATGSTAGISAAGGDVMNGLDHRFQFMVRELYRFDGLGNKISHGFFESLEESIAIENNCANGILALDGERGVIRLKFGDQIRFERATNLHLAHL